MSIPFVVIGLVLVVDTLMALCLSNINFGVVLPALLGAPLLIYGLFARVLRPWMAYGFGLGVRFVAIAGYCMFALLVIVCCILISHAAKQPVPADADAVIVLGAGVQGEKISLTLKNRLDKAAEYLQENPETLVVVSGGQGRQELVSEAEAMRRYLLGIGVQADRIILEDGSTSTLQNFAYSKGLLDEQLGEGNYSVVFVTSDFHLYRAGLAARGVGLSQAYGLGCPSHWYMLPNFYGRESLAILYYWLFGAV